MIYPLPLNAEQFDESNYCTGCGAGLTVIADITQSMIDNTVTLGSRQRKCPNFGSPLAIHDWFWRVAYEGVA